MEKVAKAASKVDWESLPSKRPTEPYANDFEPIEKGVDKKYTKFINRKNDAKLFQKVETILDDQDYLLKTKGDFKSGKEMVFNHWFEEKPVRIVVDRGEVIINSTSINHNKLNRQILRIIKK